MEESSVNLYMYLQLDVMLPLKGNGKGVSMRYNFLFIPQQMIFFFCIQIDS